MVSDVLHSIQASEQQAEEVIKEAKQKVVSMREQSKADLAAKKSSGKDAFDAEAKRRRDVVIEEEKKKDEEYSLKVQEELSALEREASGKEAQIIAELTDKVYAL